MKTTNGKKPTKTFAATVGRALRRVTLPIFAALALAAIVASIAAAYS